MKEKKTTEIATNVSSGAEKVESIAKETPAKKTVKKTTVKSSSPVAEEKIDVKKMNARSTDGKAEKESEAAKARVAAALKKKEEQAKKKEEKAKRKAEKAAKKKAQIEKRLAERKAAAEKRLAERKASAEKRLAEKKAQAEKRKADKESKIRERAHAKANRKQNRAKQKSQKQNKQKERSSQRGYGGWLAAVVSLGVVTLALTTAVTVGALDMRKTKDGMASGYRSTTYELIGIMENVDNDLDRVRVSASPVQQERILTDLLVQTRLAELDLEKLPVDVQADQNVTAFVNRVAKESERMLAKLRNGESLSKEDEELLQHLYEVNHSVRSEIGELASEMTDKDLMDYIRKGQGMLVDVLERIEKATLDENRMLTGGEKPQTRGAGTEQSALEGKQDAAVDPAKSEELCLSYFSDYKITEFQCIGETVSRGYKAYNVQGYDDKGTLLFAEIDQRNGALLRFDYYEECNEDTFNMDNAKTIAETFLSKLGYENMSAVRVRENGTTADFTFVYETDGVVFYPDVVRVKVCRTRGVVTGLDATKFLKNHKKRTEPATAITLEEAQNKLHEGLSVESSRLAVVKTLRGERAAYEFLCTYGEERYLVYTDALTGEEISIVNVKNVG